MKHFLKLKTLVLVFVTALALASSSMSPVHAGGSHGEGTCDASGKAGVSIKVGGAVSVDAGNGGGCASGTKTSHEDDHQDGHSGASTKSHDSSDEDDNDSEDDDDQAGKGSSTDDSNNDDSKPVSGKTTLPATGPGGLAAVFAAVSVAGALGYHAYLRRRLARY